MDGGSDTTNVGNKHTKDTKILADVMFVVIIKSSPIIHSRLIAYLTDLPNKNQLPFISFLSGVKFKI